MLRSASAIRVPALNRPPHVVFADEIHQRRDSAGAAGSMRPTLLPLGGFARRGARRKAPGLQKLVDPPGERVARDAIGAEARAATAAAADRRAVRGAPARPTAAGRLA